MKKKILFTLAIASLFLGCSQEDIVLSSASSGAHFQGRDCLACHNIDLKENKHLVFGGTLYKDQVVSDVDNLDQACNTDLAVELLSGNTVVYSSSDTYDGDSKGAKGKGNLFLTEKFFNKSLNGSYTVRIVNPSSNNAVLAESAPNSHPFSGGVYSSANATDPSNRVSCNACHKEGGDGFFPLYVQNNKNLCN